MDMRVLPIIAYLWQDKPYSYMKKVLATFLLTVLLAGSLTARDRKNEWGLTYSQFTLPQAAYVIGGVFGVAFSLDNFTFENMKLPGAVSLEYTRYVNDTFGFGGSVTGDFMTADKYIGKDENRRYDGQFSLAMVSVMPHVKACWFNNPHFGMYSKLAAGCAFQVGDAADMCFAGQLSPVCMDFGGDALRGYLELGFGMQGIVTVGIKKIF